MDDIRALQEELLRIARMCYAGGLQTGNGGNLSARVPGKDWMVVKASRTSFSSCTVDDMVVADFAGNPVQGDKKPSRECLLHAALYQSMPEIGSVVHCHSPWATGWASTGQKLPQATYHSAIKLGEEVPVFDTGSYVVPQEYFGIILDKLKAIPDVRAFLLLGHGQVALGETPQKALYNAELVEETAHIAVIRKMLAD